jgi:cytochrome c oxidase subunit IV
MATKTPPVTTLATILVILLVLTVSTVAISFIDLTSPWHVACGTAIAAIKGTLVVLFFMHALSSPRTTWCVIIASVGWIVILFSLTYADYMTRSMMPYVPGH